MSYSKHEYIFNDTECLVICDALNMLMKNPDKAEIDKQIAEKIYNTILYTVSNDKTYGKEKQ